MAMPIETKAKARLTACLEMVNKKIDSKNLILSRWSFEQLLSELAQAVTEFISAKFSDANFGCALIYRTHPQRCYVGGASTDRRKINFNSRYYNLVRDCQDSLTAYAMANQVGLVLDHFRDNCEALRSRGVKHHPKDCETQAKETKSYLCMPIPRNKETQVSILKDPREGFDFPDPHPAVRETSLLSTDKIERRELELLDGVSREPDDDTKFAIGAIRVTVNKDDYAERVLELMSLPVLPKQDSPSLHDGIAQVLRKGVERVGGRNVFVADFKSLTEFIQTIPSLRDGEYFAFDQLTIFLQALFDSCEVSIFEAHEVDGNGEYDEIALQLAATTALSDDGQHAVFRQAHYKEGKHYQCYFTKNTLEAFPGIESGISGKTTIAYYQLGEPYYAAKDVASPVLPGLGEIEQGKTTSFLAFAIPSSVSDQRPYGVVRIVSGKERRLGDTRPELARAVAVGSMLVWESFPRNERLQIQWKDNRDDLRKMVMGLSDANANYENSILQEFTWLLQKLFWDEDRIACSNVVAGTNGAYFELSVMSEVGDQYVVQGGWKKKSERYLKLKESGWRETRNLKAGKKLVSAVANGQGSVHPV